MEGKYYLLTNKLKIFLWVIAIVIAILLNFFFNRNYLQHEMMGTWTAVDSPFDSRVFHNVEISGHEIKVDGQEISKIKYGKKNSSKNFKRVEDKKSTLYYFSDIYKGMNTNFDYCISIPKEKSNLMYLIFFT